MKRDQDESLRLEVGGTEQYSDLVNKIPGITASAMSQVVCAIQGKMNNQERNHLITGVLRWTEGNYCLVEKEAAKESQTQLIRTALVMAHTRCQMAPEERAIRAELPTIPQCSS